MERYKIIFSDIDGTLLTSNHEVSEKTVESLKRLKALNVPFVLVSARMPQGISKVMQKINIKSPIVCYSGGLVLDEEGKILLSSGINIEKAMNVKRFLRCNWKELSTSCYCYDKWIVDNKKDKWIRQESEITSVEPIEGGLMDIVSNNEVVHKVLCMGDAHIIDEAQAELKKKYQGLSIYKSKDTYLEIMDSMAAKSRAMERLCSYFNIDISETIAIGDNYNDMDMIKAAGIGSAMGNAPEEVKKISDYVTLTNDEDGVATVIEKYFLKNN